MINITFQLLQFIDDYIPCLSLIEINGIKGFIGWNSVP